MGKKDTVATDEEVKDPIPPQDPNAEGAEVGSTSKAAKKGKSTAVRFHLNDIVTKTREFSQEVHGDEWQDIADEFAVTNAKKIRSREDL